MRINVTLNEYCTIILYIFKLLSCAFKTHVNTTH